jgi:hypothetical protein
MRISSALARWMALKVFRCIAAAISVALGVATLWSDG